MEKKRFLFMGNSHTYFHDMPEMFRRMCREGGYCEAEVFMLAQPGVTYGWHLAKETELRFALLYGDYDVLVLQQAAHSPCPSREETLRDGQELARLARNCGVEPVQIIPWAEKAKPEHQQEIYEIYGELIRRTGMRPIPIGNVFERAAETDGIPDLYWEDGEHGSPWGSYAAAAVLYAALSGRTPEGLKPEALSWIKVSDERGQMDWKSCAYPLEERACRNLQRLIWQTAGSSLFS
jgi:hypothetical protein